MGSSAGKASRCPRPGHRGDGCHTIERRGDNRRQSIRRLARSKSSSSIEPVAEPSPSPATLGQGSKIAYVLSSDNSISLLRGEEDVGDPQARIGSSSVTALTSCPYSSRRRFVPPVDRGASQLCRPQGPAAVAHQGFGLPRGPVPAEAGAWSTFTSSSRPPPPEIPNARTIPTSLA